MDIPGEWIKGIGMFRLDSGGFISHRQYKKLRQYLNNSSRAKTIHPTVDITGQVLTDYYIAAMNGAVEIRKIEHE